MCTIGVVNCGAHQASSWSTRPKIRELQQKLVHVFKRMRDAGVGIICCQELHDEQLTRISLVGWQVVTESGDAPMVTSLKVGQNQLECLHVCRTT